MDLLKALKTAQKACETARAVQLSHFGRELQVDEKGAEGLVSEADLKSEKAIADILREDFPEIPVFGEEGTFQKEWDLKETSWIVDPLDGTTNFIYGLPIYCISIGLQVKGELVVGVVDVPPWDRQYWAVKGEGAYMNGRRIHVSSRRYLSESLLATGFHPGDKKSLQNQIDIFSKLLGRARAVRRAGAAALDLCLVAEGVFDAFWEANLKPWDTAAGSLLVKEAGGVVYNYFGEPHQVLHSSIIASSPQMHSHIHPSLTD